LDLNKVEFLMAVNTGKGSRVGAVSGRSQVYNPSTGHYIKRDAGSGRFLEVKSDGKPFKGVRKEATNIKANPNVDKETAKKAERAVIIVKNRQAEAKANSKTKSGGASGSKKTK
jgi:hypothetical protein